MRRAFRVLPLFLAVGCTDPPVEPPPQTHMVGCGGTVTYPLRDTLRAPGWRVRSAAAWVAWFHNRPPALDYWAKDALKYSGSDQRCEVSLTFGGSRSLRNSPVRICAGTQDHLGNRCHWTGCGLETPAKHHFSGCNDHLATGAARCR